MMQPIKTKTAQHWIDNLIADGCEPDERLNQLVKEAAQLFKVPIAMVNLLATDQVVFKACVGNRQAACLDRNGSFCDLAVTLDEPLMITDAIKHDAFRTYELVTGDMQIRSYLGKSLHAPDGTKIATLCLLDTKPRVYSKLQRQVLTQLAERAEAQLSLMFQHSAALV